MKKKLDILLKEALRKCFKGKTERDLFARIRH
jgi:hypothetical protein